MRIAIMLMPDRPIVSWVSLEEEPRHGELPGGLRAADRAGSRGSGLR
jgi:hypothetical protein